MYTVFIEYKTKYYKNQPLHAQKKKKKKGPKGNKKPWSKAESLHKSFKKAGIKGHLF